MTAGWAAWQDAVAEAWGRRPVRVRGAAEEAPTGEGPAGENGPGPAVDPDHAFAVMIAASAPFRAGTRARSLPDVQFFTTGGQLRAPGELLPGPEDPDTAHYLDRARHRLGDPGLMLSVTQPLLLDFALWSRVRDLVTGLWRRVGWPALPVTAELAAGHGYLRTAGLTLPPRNAGLVWVLSGELTLRLWRERAEGAEPDADACDVELRGQRGDLLYWPGDHRFAEGFGDRCLALRLLVSAEHRAAVAIVKNLMIDAAQRDPAYATGAVPYLPATPPLLPDGSVAVAAPDRHIGDLVRQTAGSPDLVRTLRLQWAARRSAAGLEPTPPVRESDGPAPTAEDRIRVTSEIVRVPDGQGRAVWAVNGQLLPVAGAAGERLRTALRPGRALSVRELCAEVGAGDHTAGVLALLSRLHRLHGIDIADPAIADPAVADPAVADPAVADPQEPDPHGAAAVEENQQATHQQTEQKKQAERAERAERAKQAERGEQAGQARQEGADA